MKTSRVSKAHFKEGRKRFHFFPVNRVDGWRWRPSWYACVGGQLGWWYCRGWLFKSAEVCTNTNKWASASFSSHYLKYIRYQSLSDLNPSIHTLNAVLQTVSFDSVSLNVEVALVRYLPWFHRFALFSGQNWKSMGTKWINQNQWRADFSYRYHFSLCILQALFQWIKCFFLLSILPYLVWKSLGL